MKRKKNRKAILKVVTKSERETQKLGVLLAKTILDEHQMFIKKRATIISLEGDLGSGKTMFAKGFARGLGIRETIKSPTFVILKIYSIEKATSPPNPLSLRRRGGRGESIRRYSFFIHIDAYRIMANPVRGRDGTQRTPTSNGAKDLKMLGWRELIKNPHNIILIEWGERVRAAFPKNHIKVLFQHRAPQKRFIQFLVS